MKVIWRNKSQEVGLKSDQNGLSRPSYCNMKTKVADHLGNSSAAQIQSEISTTNENKDHEIEELESGDEVNPYCRVCGEKNNLQSLDVINSQLSNCFGIKVSDFCMAKICNHCAELIMHTEKFKQVVCAAFQPANTEKSDSTVQFQSIYSLAKHKAGNTSGSEERFVRNINLKKKKKPTEEIKSGGRHILMCSVCGHKYPMLNNVTNFMCSRCKIKRSRGKVVTCGKCRAVMPAAMIREHLEMHTQADLKGRCRLRSLPKNYIKGNAEDCVSNTNQNQAKLKCTHCKKLLPSNVNIEEHMRTAHGDYMCCVCPLCGKYMLSMALLKKHMQIHRSPETFECKYCGRIFKSIDTFQKHMKVHN